MKIAWILVLLLFGLLFLSKNVLAQVETQEEYKIIVRPTPVPLSIKTNPIIQQYVAYYKGRGRRTMETILSQSSRHEKLIRQIFIQEGVPENLCYIAQVENIWGHAERAWNAPPKPLWLFTPQIAKKYGLRKTKYLDETRSFEKATRATAQYLKSLFLKYDGNAELAIAAYNSGKGNIDRAIKKAKIAHFWSAYPYLSREARNFVPNLLATIMIANNPQGYDFADVKKDSSVEYELVRIPPSVSLERIAEYCGTDIKFIKQINPELIANITPPEPYVIRVPIGSAQIFAQRMRKFAK